MSHTNVLEVRGGCLCGAVRYASNTKPDMVVVCHCANCQKNTGSAFAITFAVPRDAIRITGDTLLTYQDNSGSSGHTFHRSFCSHCGSPLAGYGGAYPGLIFIKAGTLDDPSWVKPSTHIWCCSKQPWVSIEPDARRLTRDLD